MTTLKKKLDLVEGRTIIGLLESVIIKGPKGESREVMARIDTGATKSSLDMKLVAELHIGPVIKTKMVKSAAGSTLRPVIVTKIQIAGKEMEAEFTLADRSHMKYKALIGQNILVHNGFLIDPTRGVVQ